MKKISLLLALIVCFVTQVTKADDDSTKMGGHVGGGDVSASMLQDFMNKISAYLETEEGKQEFPEISQPMFKDLVKEIRPVVKDERAIDQFGVRQTCVSHAVPENRYVVCDLKRLPKNKLSNHPSLYRLIFHELLFQAELEKPISKDIPSDFRISSRLKLHFNKKNEWVLGKSKEHAKEDSSQYNRLSKKYNTSLHLGNDYKVTTAQLSISKFLTSESLLGFKGGYADISSESQFNVAIQYKKFVENSFYYGAEVYYLDYIDTRNHDFDFYSSTEQQKAIGLSLRFGNQWQWDNLTLGVDWFGVGHHIATIENSDDDTKFTFTYLNLNLGWSF